VRTALFIAGQYLRRVSIAADTRLFPEDHSRLDKSMTSAAFVTAFNIDDELFERTPKDAKTKLLLRGKQTSPIGVTSPQYHYSDNYTGWSKKSRALQIRQNT